MSYIATKARAGLMGPGHVKKLEDAVAGPSSATDEHIAVFDGNGKKIKDGGKKVSDFLQSVVAGTNVTIDNTDPVNPVINASGGGGDTEDLRARIYVADQPGATPYAKLAAAIAAAAQRNSGAVIIGDPTLTVVQGANDEVVIPSRVHFDANKMRFEPSAAPTSGVFIAAEEDGEDIKILNTILDGGGFAVDANIRAVGVNGIEVSGNELFNWTGYGIDITSNDQLATRNVLEEHNYIHTPAAGAIFPYCVRSGAGGAFVQGCVFHHNRFFGADPENPPAEPSGYTLENEWSADSMVFQGVWNLDFQHNRTEYSGAATWSITRGCRHVTANDNIGRMSMESSNWGSGLTIVHVANIANFYTVASGDYDVATNGVTSTAGNIIGGRISSIVPDNSGTGGWLWIDSTSGNDNWELGDDIVQAGGGGNSTISNAPVGSREAGLFYIRPLAHGIGRNNRLIDTGLKNTDVNAAYAAFNCIRTQDLHLIDNTYTNNFTDGRGATNLIGNSNGEVGYSGNRRSAQNRVDIVVGGSGSSWLYQDGGPILAQAIVTSTGVVAQGSNNISVSKSSTGVWICTMVTPARSGNYVAQAMATSAGRSANTSVQSGTQFTVRTFDTAGNPSDESFTVVVFQ